MTEDLTPPNPVGFEFLAELERTGALTKTSLTLTEEIPFGQWEALGGLFGAVKRTASFLIGDWINFGEAVYGEKYSQAADLTGLAPETLVVYASVCRRVARSRRREELSFGHHEAIAALEPKEQKRWLAEAIKQSWSRRELRDALRASGEAPPPPEQPAWSASPPEATAAAGGSEGALTTLNITGTASAAPASGVVTILPGTLNGSGSTSGPGQAVLVELCRRLVEEGIPQGWYVRIPRSTFDELAAFFAE